MDDVPKTPVDVGVYSIKPEQIYWAVLRIITNQVLTPAYQTSANHQQEDLKGFGGLDLTGPMENSEAKKKELTANGGVFRIL